MLCRHPEISCHVQKLIVRPGDDTSQAQLPRYTCPDEFAICSSIKQAAVRLDALNTFVWDADAVPSDDDIWFALRRSCPLLRHIGTGVGFYVPHHSNLFDFQNLLGFSLNLKAGFYDDNTEEILSGKSATIYMFWDMLIDRCPNLEELSINGTSLYPTDARRLVQGRWPKLRKLVLGDVVLSDPQTSAVNFFNAHQQLQVLYTSRHALPPIHLTSSLVKGNKSSFMLPHLTEFGGTLEQLQALITLGQTSLMTVKFPEPLHMHDDHIASQAISVALHGLPCLTMLSISFVIHPSATLENVNLLKAIVSSCPRLVDLELRYLQNPSFPLESFSKAIRNLHKLRTFSLTLVKLPFDEPLHKSAVQLALANPRLRRFTITFNPNTKSWLPVPQALASHLSSYIESGTYTVITDEHGLPMSLSIVERCAPWSLRPISYKLKRAIIRRYQINLRPRSLKDNPVGLKGLGLLAMEKSTAGEELRMLLIFVVLFCLAMWGFLVTGKEGEG